MPAPSTPPDLTPRDRPDPRRLRLVLLAGPGSDQAARQLRELMPDRLVVTTATSLAEAQLLLARGGVDGVLVDAGGLGVAAVVGELQRAAPDVAVVVCGTDPANPPTGTGADGTAFWLHEPPAGLLARGVLHAVARHRAEVWSQQLHTLLSAAPDGMVVLDPDGVVRYANKAAADLLGPSGGEDLLGRSVELPAGRQRREVELTRGGSRRLGEVRGVDVDWLGTPARLAVIQDTTEQRLVLDRLREAEKSETIGRLAGGLAHDFNNLLTVVRTSLELIETEPGLSETTCQLLGAIRNASERASTLTRQLLTFGRRSARDPGPVDLNGVVRRAADLLHRLLREDIELAVRLEPELGLVEADTGELEQVVLNLALHARDELPDGGRIAVETERRELDPAAATGLGLLPGRYAVLTVRDNGPGMAEELTASLFEPFTRPAGRARRTGLGLASSYVVADRCGGTIAVDSAPGAGTAFRVYLPATATSSQPTAPAEPVVAGRGGQTVLLVEDEPEVRRLTRMVLEREGFTVLDADGAATALAILERHGSAIDLLLTDVVMPGMNGFELADAASRRHPQIRRLFMSGYPDAPRPATARPDHLLAKPFTSAELLRRTAEALAGGHPGGHPG
ncbi:MAG: response regulator [Actinobacteria bacterium]|nr:response regulator [Actinomycetota bacterium]